MAVEPVDLTAAYEETISLIPGILAVRVEMDHQEATEVHILGDTTRHPMQLVRDVESSIMARFGVRIDHKRISIAQVEPAPTVPPRLALSGVYLAITGNEAEVRAELQWHDRIYSGSARGLATARGRLVLAAQAVLQAAAGLLPKDVRFELETLDSLTMAGENTILVLISLLKGQQVQSLAGAAFVRRDETEAAGRATLAAINRRMELFTSE